jgi:hypothetical protein
MPIDTFKYGKTAAEVVIEHLTKEIEAVEPFLGELTNAFAKRKCIAAWDLLSNLRQAAEKLADKIVGDDPGSYWDCEPRSVRQQIEQALIYDDGDDNKKFWERERQSLCTCDVCRQEALKLKSAA